MSVSREEYRQFWFYWEMTPRKCWRRWINSVLVGNTGDRLCWLRGSVVPSLTRVLSAWICTRGCPTVEDVSVSMLPAADMFGELSNESFFEWFCPRRLVARCGAAPRPLHGKSERHSSSQLPVEVSVLVSHLFDHPGCTVGTELCGTTSLGSTRLHLFRTSRLRPLVVVLSMHKNHFWASRHKGSSVYVRWFRGFPPN